MNARLHQLLLPPVFTSENQNRRAVLLNQILWAGLAITTSILLVSLTIYQLSDPIPSYDLIFVAVHVIALVLLNRRILVPTAILYCSTLWLLITFGVTFTGELWPSLGFLAVVTLIAGVVINPRAGYVFAALTMATSFGFLAMVNADFLPLGTAVHNPWLLGFSMTVNLFLVAFVVSSATRALVMSLRISQSRESELIKRRNQLQAATEISRLATTSPTLEDLLAPISSLLVNNLNLYHVSIFSVDKENGMLTMVAQSTRGHGRERDAYFEIPLKADSLITTVARSQKPYLARDVSRDPLFVPNPKLSGITSEAALPILSNNQLFGVLSVSSDAAEELSWDEVNVLQIIANQVGTAIQNVQLMAASERHIQEVEVLNAIANAGIEASNEDELIQRATEIVGNSLFPSNFGVLLIDYSRGVLVHHRSYQEKEGKPQPPIKLGTGITGLVALSGQATRIADVALEPKYISVDTDARSELCVPIRVGSRVLGVINLESHKVNAFSDADQKLLEAIASQLAIALEKIRLLGEPPISN